MVHRKDARIAHPEQRYQPLRDGRGGIVNPAGGEDGLAAGGSLGFQRLQDQRRDGAGQFVVLDIVLGLLEERLAGSENGSGFILDGFPRNLAQANALDELLDRIGQPVDEALQIDVDEEQVVERIAKRAALEGRSDDTEETVRNRLKVYAEQTAPVVDHYAEMGILSRVLGEGSIEEVFERIKGVLQISSDS